MQNNTVINSILEVSKSVNDNRTQYAVLAKAGEEYGELSQEVMIRNGDHYKQPGKDGIIGEAIDLIICCTDLIYSENPNITEDEIVEIAKLKLAKWKSKSSIVSDAK